MSRIHVLVRIWFRWKIIENMLFSFSYTDNKETNQQIDSTRIGHVVIAIVTMVL